MKLFLLLILITSAAAHADDLPSADKLVAAALERTKHAEIYHGAYFKIDYPNGDIPARYGVCTDVVIRSYRVLDIDLQRLVHEDMRGHFSQYPAKRIWN